MSGLGVSGSASWPRWRDAAASIGVRLLLLLLAAELPLIVYTISVSVQIDTLRAQAATVAVQSALQTAATRITDDLQTASVVADRIATLPQGLLHDPTSCSAALSVVVQSNPRALAGAAVLTPGQAPCLAGLADAGSLDPGLAVPATGQVLLSDPSGLLVATRLQPPNIETVVVRLARSTAISVLDNGRRARAGQSGQPLWLRRADGWMPLDHLATSGGLPAQPRPSSLSGPFVAESSDRREFVYTPAVLPPSLSASGSLLLLGTDVSDIRRRTDANARLRMLMLLGMLAAEAILIFGGVWFAVSSPVTRLTAAVRRWRSSGTFDPQLPGHDPTEIAALADSFGEATRSLNRREADLAASMRHQDVLLKEIHHRVKNNLQIVASLLNLQASRIRVPEAQAEFQSARDRVRALATLHRHLYGDGELNAIDLRAFFAELCSQLFQAFGEAEGDRIQLSIIAPQLDISSDQAVPIALVVTETVGNALKYAFPGDRRGTITLSLVVDGLDQATLTVADDGVGTEPQNNDRRGLGVQLVRGFARQLGATLTVSREGGTCYRLDMKLMRRRPEERPMVPGHPAPDRQA